MTFATHNYLAGRRPNAAKWLGVTTKAIGSSFLQRISGYFQGLTAYERLENQRTCATSTPDGILDAKAGGSTGGCGFAPTKPGNKKSSGETLLVALMPLQPLVRTISAKETAPIATFRFIFKGPVQF